MDRKVCGSGMKDTDLETQQADPVAEVKTEVIPGELQIKKQLRYIGQKIGASNVDVLLTDLVNWVLVLSWGKRGQRLVYLSR